MIFFCCSVSWNLLSTDVPQRPQTYLLRQVAPQTPTELESTRLLTFLAPQIPHHHVIHSLGFEDGFL